MEQIQNSLLVHMQEAKTKLGTLLDQLQMSVKQAKNKTVENLVIPLHTESMELRQKTNKVMQKIESLNVEKEKGARGWHLRCEGYGMCKHSLFT